jgi:hypothetical protein
LHFEARSRRAEDWRRWLVRALGAALALKLAALLIIKSVFFSAAHEPVVTPRLVDQRLAVEAETSSPPDRDSPR